MKLRSPVHRTLARPGRAWAMCVGEEVLSASRSSREFFNQNVEHKSAPFFCAVNPKNIQKSNTFIFIGWPENPTLSLWVPGEIWHRCAIVNAMSWTVTINQNCFWTRQIRQNEKNNKKKISDMLMIHKDAVSQAVWMCVFDFSSAASSFPCQRMAFRSQIARAFRGSLVTNQARIMRPTTVAQQRQLWCLVSWSPG